MPRNLDKKSLASGPQDGLTGQIAALPMRASRKDALELLLITSRDTGRWIIPKGWTMERCALHEAAAIEARQEAGVEGIIGRRALGQYNYDKILEKGEALPCRVDVFPLAVQRLHERWKERAERERRWFSPEEAARAVRESDLASLLADADRLMRILRKLEKRR